jgi:hypothetical protein
VFDIELSRQTLSPNIACEALGEIMFAKRTIYFVVPLAFFAASILIHRGYLQVTEQRIIPPDQATVVPRLRLSVGTEMRADFVINPSLERRFAGTLSRGESPIGRKASRSLR